MNKYPTKEEILSYSDLPANQQAIAVIKDFKKDWRETKDNITDEMKHALIRSMLIKLAKIFQVEEPKTSLGDYFCYIPAEQRIVFGPKPSIISSLHEFGHHLYGSSELLACVFSVNHFKEAFPIAYKNLKWKGHMLTK
jgi:hypothetical protein